MASGTVVYIRWHTMALDRMLKSRHGEVGRYVEKKADRARDISKTLVGKRTGRLAASIGVSYNRTSIGPEFQVGSSLSIAHLHHTGTRPHLIVAKPPGILRFRGSRGTMVYKRAVKHPGTRPNPYLTTALKIVMRT